MKRTHPTLLLAALFACALAPALWAQSDEEIARELDALKERVAGLETRLNESKLDKAKEDKAKSERDKIALTMHYKDGFKITSPGKRFSFQINGRLQFDSRLRLNSNADKFGEQGEFRKRRIYLGATGVLYKYWKFVLNGEYEGSSVVSKTTNYIENSYIKSAKIRVGQFGVPFGLEDTISNKYVKFTERSMAANFISPFYDVGWMIHGQPIPQLAYYVAVTNGSETARDDSDNGKYVWAKLLLKPFAETDGALKKLFIGVAGMRGRSKGLSPGSDGGSSVGTTAGTTVISYTSTAAIDGPVTRGNLSAGIILGSLLVMGEVSQMRRDIEVTLSSVLTDSTNIDWLGGHVTVAYLLTGEEQSLGRIHPLNNCEPGQEGSGVGAWEVAARWDFLENDRGDRDTRLFSTRLDRVDQVTVGVNWYPNPMVKISLNYIHAWWERGNLEERSYPHGGTFEAELPNSEDSLVLRVQLEF